MSDYKKTSDIAALNDRFRMDFDRSLGKINADDVFALEETERDEILYLVQTFSEFSGDNKYHDRGEIQYGGRHISWRIHGFDRVEYNKPTRELSISVRLVQKIRAFV